MKLLILLLLPCLLVSVHLSAYAQPVDRITVRPLPLTSFNITIGVTVPQGREGLRELWLAGPGGSAEFLIHLNPIFAVGVGADMSLLYFDESAFALRWPGVVLKEKKNLFLGNVYLDASIIPLPGRQTRPYVGVQLGAEFISEALYREIVGGIRRTYYEVGGRPRLTIGTRAGAAILLAYNFGILAELKGTFVHNDPAISFLAHVRAGIQFKF